MTTPAPVSYAGYRFPAESITHGVWLYFRWPARTAYTGTAAPRLDTGAWRCLGNLVGKADRRGNLYPTKQRPDQKIDAAVAPMMAVGRAMTEDQATGHFDDFLSRPLSA